MAQPELNRRLMIALARCGHTGDVRAIEFGVAVKRIAGPSALERIEFALVLPSAGAIDAQHLERLMLAVTASAAYGVIRTICKALLNYLRVDERRHFKWDTEFLELFTLSELESLACEVGLKARMQTGFKLARARKKCDFIKALLAVPGFVCDGTVPSAMRYPRAAISTASLAGSGNSLGNTNHKSSPGLAHQITDDLADEAFVAA